MAQLLGGLVALPKDQSSVPGSSHIGQLHVTAATDDATTSSTLHGHLHTPKIRSHRCVQISIKILNVYDTMKNRKTTYMLQLYPFWV